jgi:hypothetical protein
VPLEWVDADAGTRIEQGLAEFRRAVESGRLPAEYRWGRFRGTVTGAL